MIYAKTPIDVVTMLEISYKITLPRGATLPQVPLLWIEIRIISNILSRVVCLVAKTSSLIPQRQNSNTVKSGDLDGRKNRLPRPIHAPSKKSLISLEYCTHPILNSYISHSFKIRVYHVKNASRFVRIFLDLTIKYILYWNTNKSQWNVNKQIAMFNNLTYEISFCHFYMVHYLFLYISTLTSLMLFPSK